MQPSYNLTAIFRWLIALNVAAMIGVPIVLAAAFPDVTTHHESLTAIQVALASVDIVLFVTSSVGLFRFKRWARPLFVIAFALIWMENIFASEDQISDIELYATNIASVCDGALLALMWASPLAGRFSKAALASGASEQRIGAFLYDRMIRWPDCGRLAAAAFCAAIVGSAIFLLPTSGEFVIREAVKSGLADLGSWSTRFAIFMSATDYLLHWAIFWSVAAFVFFPLIHLVLSYRGVSSRWAYAAMGAAMPLLLIVVIELISPQTAKRDVLFVPIFGGIPAGLVFGAIARHYPATTQRRRGRSVAFVTSVLSLMLVGIVGGGAWSVMSDNLLKAEWRYRMDHLTWPVLCFAMGENVRLAPHLAAGESDDLAACKELAMQGDAVAQVMMADGKFGQVSPADRAAWLDKAAAQNYKPAIHSLASMLSPLSADRGVPKDGKRAMQLYLQLAERGDVLSQLILGVAYKKGAGVEQDMVAALMWREVAAATAEAHPGETQLRNLRKAYDEFAVKQPPEQVAEAHRRAQEFLTTHDY